MSAGPATAEARQTRRSARARWWLATPALLTIAALSLLPLCIVILYSVLERDSYGGVLWALSGEAWVEVFFQRDIFDGTLAPAEAHLAILWRSVRLALITTGLTLLIGVPTAYFIGTRPAQTRNLWLFAITVPFWTSLLIRIIAIGELIRRDGLVNAALLQLGLIEEPLQMLFTDFAIGLGMTYVYLPLMVLPVYAAVQRLDPRLLEAAYDLYASRARTFRRVILPLIRPGVIAGSLLVFIPALGDYVTPRVLGGGSNLMIGNLIELQFGQGRNWPLGAALALTLMVLIGLALIPCARLLRGKAAPHG
ncbi:ABC transporter permease [Paracoccus liaowanqingii]|uniref:ABC transporter permease n=1 Tax=Paracoccus liaowanqingii TaxID=2560053 RepID=A0A4P7HLB3_9RHOB|nr:ABC transporter permease [Paracoccus liaowanqingii]QBX34956.1 ABC transporter permease [Paracoccus liaowanqingii]